MLCCSYLVRNEQKTKQFDNKKLIRRFVILLSILLVVCIQTRPTGSSKEGTTCKNTQRQYTPKRLMRYICLRLYLSSSGNGTYKALTQSGRASTNEGTLQIFLQQRCDFQMSVEGNLVFCYIRNVLLLDWYRKLALLSPAIKYRTQDNHELGQWRLPHYEICLF